MVNWDAVTGVATACGSLVGACALIVAAVTLVKEGARWRADRAREEEQRREAERGLASFVSAVTENHDASTALVVATNDGEQPVFNVRVTPTARGAHLISRSDKKPSGDVIRRLNPRERVSFRFQTLPGEAEWSGPVIDYFDVAGRRWRRSGFGAPERCFGWWDEDESDSGSAG